MTVLITGFEPFDGSDSNISGDLATLLDGTNISGVNIVGRVMPVTFRDAPLMLGSLINQYSPILVICLGLAANRTSVSIETTAFNEADARIPDNAGYQPSHEVLVENGPPKYKTTLPLSELGKTLTLNGVPWEYSDSAGLYVCNCVFYNLMHFLSTTQAKGGFVHLPLAGSKGRADELLQGLKLIISTALAQKK